MPKKPPTHGVKPLPERKREYDRGRRAEQPWRQWYTSARWKRLRKFVLAREPYCPRCQVRDGRVVPADTVNHIKPHKGDPGLFWAVDNIEGVCASCHSSEIQREEKRK